MGSFGKTLKLLISSIILIFYSDFKEKLANLFLLLIANIRCILYVRLGSSIHHVLESGNEQGVGGSITVKHCNNKNGRNVIRNCDIASN